VLPLLLPLPLVLAANWQVRPPRSQGPAARVGRALGSASWAGLGVVVALTGFLGLVSLLAPPQFHSPAYGAALLLGSLAAGAILVPAVRRAVSRLVPIDPGSALDATALVLIAILLGFQLGNQLGSDVLADQAHFGPALRPLDLIVQEIPFLLAAFLGVGVFIRRDPGQAMERLGLVRPALWQIGLALAAAGLFVAFSSGVDALSQALTPDIARKVNTANQRLFGQLGDPVGIATIALSAGICEEIFFRGALQPRVGLVLTSITFAAVHTQYGLSLDVMAVFVLSLGLGALRRIANTTTTIVCHVVYNALVGIGLDQSWLVPAVAVETGLIILTATIFFTTRVGGPRLAK
jgi:membrane protease YdiL (CAAX protease family)